MAPLLRSLYRLITHFASDGSASYIIIYITPPKKSTYARNAIPRGNKFQTGLKPHICERHGLRQHFGWVASPDGLNAALFRASRARPTGFRPFSLVLRLRRLIRPPVGVATRGASNGTHDRVPPLHIREHLWACCPHRDAPRSPCHIASWSRWRSDGAPGALPRGDDEGRWWTSWCRPPREERGERMGRGRVGHDILVFASWRVMCVGFGVLQVVGSFCKT